VYLVEINKRSGLVAVDKEYDGIRSIKAFRDILDDPELGIECMTAIALTVDHLTPFANYSLSERHRRAMYEVTGNRDAFVWNQEKIQVALNKYDELQYNPALMEKLLLENMQRDQLKELERLRGEGADASKLKDKFSQLNLTKGLLEQWKKDNDIYEEIKKGPVKGKYRLKRLERKIEDKQSFYQNQ
jgi:hypothetical protein